MARTPAAYCLVFLLVGCGRDDEAQSAEARPRSHVYEFGEKVQFGFGGDSERFRLDGWSHTEPRSTWTQGIGASLAFRVPASQGRTVQLTMQLQGMTKPGRVDSQPVTVLISGEQVAKWDVTGEQATYTATLPAKFFNDRESPLVIDFFLPRAISPEELGFGPDSRRLGICCFELMMAPAPGS